MAYSPTLIGAIGALTVSILVVRLIQQSRVPLPPGPRGLPWFGNVFQWPVEKEWLTFTRWYHRYGISSLSVIEAYCLIAISTLR